MAQFCFFGCLFFDPALLEAEKTGKIRWYFGKGDNSYPFFKMFNIRFKVYQVIRIFPESGKFRFWSL